MARKSGKKPAKAASGASQRPKRTQRSVGTRETKVPLADFREVHSRMELSHSGKVTRVRLCDQVTPFQGSQFDARFAITKTVPFFLKGQTSTVDVYAQILPKLQGFASVYQRYRVTRAKLMYQSLSSAVTNGNVGLVIQDGLATATKTVAELASFQQSVVSAIYNSVSTPEWRSLEQRWFYTRDAFSASVVPFTMNFLMQGPISSDVVATQSVTNGLFWLDLTIEFMDLCPVPSTRLTLLAGEKDDSNQVISDTTGPKRTVRWNRAPGMSGLWGWATGQTRQIRDSASTSYVLDPKQCWDMDSGNFVGSGRLSLTAAATPGTETKDPDDSYVRLLSPPAVKRYGRADIDNLSGLDVGCGPTQKGYTKVLCAFPSLKAARTARQSGFDPNAFSPTVAGDFLVQLRCQDEDGIVETVFSKLFSLGTGAAIAEFIWRWVEDNPCTISCFVVPAGTEVRSIVAGSSVLQIQQADESIPALDP